MGSGLARQATSILLALVPAAARAQMPAFRHFDVESGLAHGRITCILADSRGYVWLGTWEGLSRFDGVEFQSFGPAQGLPSAFVSALVEGPRGELWIGTYGGGLFRLDPDAGARAPALARVALDGGGETATVFELSFDGQGRLWCGTKGGLLCCAQPEQSAPQFELELAGAIEWLEVDPRGRGAWAGSASEVLHVDAGAVERIALPAGETRQNASWMDALGLLVATPEHVYELEGGAWRDAQVPLESGATFRALLRDPDGTLYVGSSSGLLRRGPAGDELWTEREGLPEKVVETLGRDREGNLWAGLTSAGVVVFLEGGIESWTCVEGQRLHGVMWLVEEQDGGIVAGTSSQGLVEIRGRAARWIEGSQASGFRSAHMRLLQDRAGRWWIGTNEALWLAPGPRLDLGSAHCLGPEQGGPATGVFGMIEEDPSGRIRFGSFDGRLYECDPDAEGGVRLTSRSLAGPPALGEPRALWSDARSRLWLASYEQLAVLDGERLELLDAAAGYPLSMPRCLIGDSRGQLWIGTRFEGVWTIADPLQERPRLVQRTTRDGLPSNSVWWATEDGQGALWLATSRGLCRLDPDGHTTRTLGLAEGLPGDHVPCVLRARDGALWAATSAGISRLDPDQLAGPSDQPQSRLTHVEFAGSALALSELGATAALAGALDALTGPLRVEWTAPCVRSARELRFECRLQPIDADWTPAQSSRSIRYAALAPGDYRFQVRAQSAEPTSAAGAPAELRFTILPPLWRRPWFVGLVLAALAGLGWTFHRARVRRALALERIRGQIATDIHDDLGSGLSQVAVLAEVARRAAPGTAGLQLEEIARLARTMRESMAEIVWAVDPRRDSVGDLVQRLRQVAGNLLEAGGVQVDVAATPGSENEILPPGLRRHLYLFAKEALTNAARHARAQHVRLDLELRSRELELTIQDDGAGFDPDAATSGHGLNGLRRRAATLQGALAVDTAAGRGTRIRLVAPRPS